MRVDKTDGGQGAGVVTKAALDPRVVLDDPDYQAVCTLKRTLYSHSLYHLGTECLGVDKKATIYVTDPGVIRSIDRYSEQLIAWLKARKAARERGELAFNTPRKIMHIQPRETMKSAFPTAMSPVMASIWDPEIATCISSYKFEEVATKFGKSVRNHWKGVSENSQFEGLFGKFWAHNLPWNDGSAVIAPRRRMRTDPTLKVFSVETGGTSGHYDLVILDDPVAQEQVEKYKERWFQKCWAHYLSLGMITNQDGMFVLVMTRYGEGDLCGMIIEREIEKKVRELDLPNAPEGVLPDDFDRKTGWIKYAHHAGWFVTYDSCWEGDINSEDPKDYTLNFPIVWPRERILEKLLTDNLFVMAQLQNQPSERADRLVQQAHIDACWFKQPPKQCYQDLTIHMDIAWKSGESYLKQKGDWNVIQIWGHHEGHVYLVWGRFGKWTQEEFGDRFCDAVRWCQDVRGRRARLATCDKGLGGTKGSIANYLKSCLNKRGLALVPVLELQRGKKIDRIVAASAFWVDGSVHLQEGVPGAKELADQMLNIGYSGQDDMADCASDAVSEEVYRIGRRTPIAGQLPDDYERLDWTTSVPVGDDWSEEDPIRVQIGGVIIEYPTEENYVG